MSRARLVGRARELGVLVAALDAAADGTGAVVLLSGEPGIGKTRLLEETALRASERGFQVAWGRAWEVGGAPIFWPWVEAVRALLARPGGRDGADELVRLLPELGGGDAAIDGAQLLDALLGYLQTTAARAPVLVVLDDLHAADPSSVALAERVARLVRGHRVALVGSTRDVEARLTPAIDAGLARMARAGERVEVARLRVSDVEELVADAVGGPGPEAAQMIHDATEGNPLFVGELLRLLAARGTIERRGVPAGVRAVIRERLGLLAPATVALLQAAAVVGREFLVTLAAEVAGVTPAALEDAADEARGAELLDVAGPGRLRFSHALVAETLAADLGAGVRMRLHRRAAEVLARVHAGDPAAPLDAIAHHWCEAGADAAPQAVLAARAAGDAAMARLAFADAAVAFERALGALAIAAPGDAAARIALGIAAGEAHVRAGDRERGAAVCSAASEQARALGDGVACARAGLAMGAEPLIGVPDPDTIRLLGDALPLLPDGDDPWRARVLARLASASQPSMNPREPVAIARDAIAMARRLGDPEVLRHVLHAAMGAMTDFAMPAEREPLNAEAARLAVAVGDRPRAARALIRLCFDRIDLGDVPGFERALAEYEAVVTGLTLPRYRWVPIQFRAMRALWEGRFDDADRLAAEAHALRAQAREGDVLPRAVWALYRAALTDDADQLEAEYAAALDAGLTLNRIDRAMLTAWVRVKQGRPADALAELRVIEGVELGGDAIDLHAGAVLGEVAYQSDDPVRRAWTRRLLEPHAGRPVMITGIGFALGDVIDRVLMRLAAADGDLEAAARHARDGLALCERLGARPIAAKVRAEWAQISAPAPEPAPAPASPPGAVALVREGEYWTVRGFGELCRIKDSRGMQMLARLIAEPGRELHALDLSGADLVDGGDAGVVLDAPARAAYETRVRDLRAALAEAEAWNDAGRRERLEAELDAIGAELAAALGLGGRERRTGGAAERARSNVRRRLADAMRRIQDACPALGRHLAASVRTGVFCVYAPP